MTGRAEAFDDDIGGAARQLFYFEAACSLRALGEIVRGALDDNLPNLPPDIKDNISGKLSDKDDSAGYNEQTRELLDALIEETVE